MKKKKRLRGAVAVTWRQSLVSRRSCFYILITFLLPPVTHAQGFRTVSASYQKCGWLHGKEEKLSWYCTTIEKIKPLPLVKDVQD